MLRCGIDVGSTTLKLILADSDGKMIFSRYERHHSKISETAVALVGETIEKVGDTECEVALSGSAGMGVAEDLSLPFVQEVYAEKIAVEKNDPGTDVVIELGGEDAKILFLSGGFEMRMNGSCAGGTGAFIDQMSSLMNVTSDELDALASRSTRPCTVASRCGVFAKSDVQPLLNQGIPKEDIAAGVLDAVVSQTVAGLAQGRSIRGNILYLGGPLYFYPTLRKSFDRSLKAVGKCPENALYYVALGAAMSKTGCRMTLSEISALFASRKASTGYAHSEPLFKSKEEYDAFKERHEANSKGIAELSIPADEMYLGIDAGSTTVKAVLCDRDGNIYRPFYSANKGDPIVLLRSYLDSLYNDWPSINIVHSAVTGYGEELIKNAFGVDIGVVETVAHYTAAKRFRPDVDFILDIGGQDIKCFKIKNGTIDSLYLNEACSSGCGSFLQTFAAALGYSAEDFAKLGLFAKAPVELGSRCTVFMNSAVKQAQKDGADIESIAAGLFISVVKNALYKVIRCADAERLGDNIVVQGGTFLNDSVLRAFERETGKEVIRPKYAALMGAFGAALYAKEHSSCNSSFITKEKLDRFTHIAKTVTCNGCTNKCTLTVNSFGDGRRYIAGNRCQRPIHPDVTEEKLDLYDYKRELLGAYRHLEADPAKKTVGIPLGLIMYELLPFWHTFFSSLGFNVLVSPESDRELYLEGQHTIPSDTVCYPAKMMHGHIEWLLDREPDVIFYPDMSYNIDEGLGANHYNCPVVAYYPQVLLDNVERLNEKNFICDFLSLNDPAFFKKRMKRILPKYFDGISKRDIGKAADLAFAEYSDYLSKIRGKAEEYISLAKRDGKPVIVLAGRPYHLDPEINHGIHSLLCDLGAVVISEDSISHLVDPFPTGVRNQWTYHSRLYAAAKYIADSPEYDNINLVQLVSFGCGVDAVTTDEVREILENSGRIYTQLKIDEISNMGATVIRLRSLFSVIEDRYGKADSFSDGSCLNEQRMPCCAKE